MRSISKKQTFTNKYDTYPGQSQHPKINFVLSLHQLFQLVIIMLSSEHANYLGNWNSRVVDMFVCEYISKYLFIYGWCTFSGNGDLNAGVMGRVTTLEDTSPVGTGGVFCLLWGVGEVCASSALVHCIPYPNFIWYNSLHWMLNELGIFAIYCFNYRTIYHSFTLNPLEIMNQLAFLF